MINCGKLKQNLGKYFSVLFILIIYSTSSWHVRELLEKKKQKQLRMEAPTKVFASGTIGEKKKFEFEPRKTSYLN